MSLKRHFSRDILFARTEIRQLTQQQVADAVTISLREYQKIEKGELLPRTEIFLRLVFFFDLEIQSYRKEVTKHASVHSR